MFKIEIPLSVVERREESKQVSSLKKSEGSFQRKFVGWRILGFGVGMGEEVSVLSMGMARVLKVDSDSIYGSNFEFDQLQSQEYELEPTGWIKGIGHCRYNVFQQLRISH